MRAKSDLLELREKTEVKQQLSQSETQFTDKLVKELTKHQEMSNALFSSQRDFALKAASYANKRAQLDHVQAERDRL